MENGNQRTQATTLNQYTMSQEDSSYHIYEMTEIADDEASGRQPQEPQEVADTTDDVPTHPHRKKRAYTWSSKGYNQGKSQHDSLQRHNTVSEYYEFMMPQLQGATAKKKTTTLPVSTADAHSTLSDDGQSQQSNPYIFMQPEQPTEQFSSFLSKWFDLDKEDTNENTSCHAADQDDEPVDLTLSDANEEDVYITVL